MNELEKYQKRVKAVYILLNGRIPHSYPVTVDGCKSLLKLIEERYGVIY